MKESVLLIELKATSRRIEIIRDNTSDETTKTVAVGVLQYLTQIIEQVKVAFTETDAPEKK